MCRVFCTALQIDRQWYGVPLYWERDDAAGLWHPSEDWPPLPPGVKDPAAARLLLPRAASAARDTWKANGATTKGSQAAAAASGGPGTAAAEQDGVQTAGLAVAAAGQNGKQCHPIVAAARARMAANSTASKPAAGVAAGAVVAAANAAAAAAATAGEVFSEEVEEALKNCLVLVDVDIPLVALSDGVHARSFAGNGLVVYHGEHLGLVLVSEQSKGPEHFPAIWHRCMVWGPGQPAKCVYAYVRAW